MFPGPDFPLDHDALLAAIRELIPESSVVFAAFDLKSMAPDVDIDGKLHPERHLVAVMFDIDDKRLRAESDVAAGREAECIAALADAIRDTHERRRRDQSPMLS